MCAMPEETERMAEVIGGIAKLAHRKEAKFIFQNCGGKSIKNTLIPKIKKVKSSARTITFENKDSYHLSFTINNAMFAFIIGNYRSIGSTLTCRIYMRI
jgi:predicted mannosyl-3-phosphoglycerate phosphatase (HAD superfamily)